MARWLARWLTGAVDLINEVITVDDRRAGVGSLLGRSGRHAVPCHVATLLAIALSLSAIAMRQTSKVSRSLFVSSIGIIFHIMLSNVALNPRAVGCLAIRRHDK